MEVLSAVSRKEMPLSELRESAVKYRAMENIRKAFCKCTNSSWDDARQRFPSYTSPENLEQFSNLSFQKCMPEAFAAYCRAALQSEHQPEGHLRDSYELNGVRAYAIEHDVMTLSYSDIRDKGIQFNGAHLFLVHIPEV